MKKPKMRSTEFMKTVETFVKFAAKSVKDPQTLNDITMYDTCITILIIAATSLRIEEVHSLRLEHFIRIRKNLSINIKNKGSVDSERDIAYNKLLENCYVIIAKNRKLYELKALKTTYVNNRFRHYRPNHIRDGCIVVTSIPQLRRKLIEIASILNMSGAIVDTKGFTAFRKYITTLIVSSGENYLASSMNKHSRFNTTTKYYDERSD